MDNLREEKGEDLVQTWCRLGEIKGEEKGWDGGGSAWGLLKPWGNKTR